MIDSHEGMMLPGEGRPEATLQHDRLAPENQVVPPMQQEVELTPAQQAERAAAIRALEATIAEEQQNMAPLGPDRAQSEQVPTQQVAAPREKLAPVQTLKQLANKLTSPFRGIMNLVRSIGRWIAK